jgi:hypothetical protein
MNQDISEHIEQLVSQIDNTITGTFNIVEDRTDVCKTKWIRIGKNVTDSSGNEYIVTDLEVNSWIKTQPVDPFNTQVLEGVITIDTPFFITGTRKSANSEWTKNTNFLLEKTPLVWYLDSIRFRSFGRDSALEYESEVRIFFVDETNIRQFYTKDHRIQVVKPMTALVENFLDVLKKNRQFRKIENFDVLTFSRFGVEKQDGMLENILDANLSGVELRLTLTRFKENCKINCN